jgi:cell division protein ZapE
VVVVATSNIVPDDLFKGQPGRDAFQPFIALIKQRLDVLVLDAGRDFRRARLRAMPTWYVPADGRADLALDDAFVALTAGARPQPTRLTVMGRTLVVPLAAEGVARFDFAALCGSPLGAGDYLALATHFHTLILDGIPRLSPNNYDQARRFIVLVDALYDHRVKLIASADAWPDQLYERGEGARAFERTASRLEEMQSEDWLALPHLP